MKIQVLDHGYIELVEHWGSDERIVEAARMSTGKGFTGWGPIHRYDYAIVHDLRDVNCPCGTKPGDEKLLSYLWTHKHHTPFEMAGMTIEVQAPIFVLREWMRHRSQSYNELSARYTPVPDLNYVPDAARLLQASSSQNKQQAYAGVLSESGAEGVRGLVTEIYEKLEHSYQHMLANGVPKELARVILPVGRYSRMRASANLRNWLAFMTLRCDAHAQWEIRQYANEVSRLVAGLFPRTHELWSAR